MGLETLTLRFFQPRKPGDSVKLFASGFVVMWCLVCVGCTLSFPQVDAAVNFINQTTVSDSKKSRNNEVATWLAQIGDRGAVLYPYAVDGLTVFANDFGDAVAFDGWTVRAVYGFDLTLPLQIVGQEGLRTIKYGSQELETFCGPWLSKRVDEYLEWRQTCSAGDGYILVNADGNIRQIQMSLGQVVGDIVLRVED